MCRCFEPVCWQGMILTVFLLLDAQDGNPPGEGVIISDIDRDGWVRVRWDNGATNSYRMGKDGKHDLRLAPSEVPKKPSPEENEVVEDIRLSEGEGRGGGEGSRESRVQ